jgi:hypothetical protein
MFEHVYIHKGTHVYLFTAVILYMNILFTGAAVVVTAVKI